MSSTAKAARPSLTAHGARGNQVTARRDDGRTTQEDVKSDLDRPDRTGQHGGPNNGTIPAIDVWARELGLEGTAVLTTAEAAALLRICERSVRQGITDGRIPHVRLGRRLLIPVPGLLAVLLGACDSQS